MKLWLAWLLPVFVAAWTAQELEIFNLRDAVIRELGEEATFYSWLNVPSNADGTSIRKAYRKLSRDIHPDKAPGRDAEERYSRLGRVNKILNGNGRDIYDFYLRHGFPTLRDGDYLFNRYRPGMLFVAVFVVLAFTIVNYGLLKLSANRKRAFLQGIIDEVVAKAKGPLGVVTSKKRVTLSNEKIFVVYPDSSVYLVDGAQELLVTIDDVAEPTFFDTLPLRMFKPKEETGQKLGSEPASIEKEVPEVKKASARHHTAGPRGKAKAF